MSDAIRLAETTPARNWPAGRRPEWVDERTRVYTGVTVDAAAHEWRELVSHFDGEVTTVYLTANGFDLGHKGPAIHRAEGERACHRRAVREWFRDQYHVEVEFDG